MALAAVGRKYGSGVERRVKGRQVGGYYTCLGVRKVWSSNESKLISNFLVWPISHLKLLLFTEIGKTSKETSLRDGDRGLKVCFWPRQWSGDNNMESKGRFQIYIWINKSGV